MKDNSNEICGKENVFANFSDAELSRFTMGRLVQMAYGLLQK